MKIVINGKEFKAQENQTVLEVALKNGINIPHLCWHPALEPYGACRVCLVEVERHGRKRLTTACTYPVEEGLKVHSDTEKVIKARRFSISLLIMLAPEAEKILELAEKYDVAPVPAGLPREPSNCIRCGLCVRVCKELIGVEAIGFINRGVERIPETPFREDNPVCLSCGACAYLCPTGKIKVLDREVREIDMWHKEAKLAVCPGCGKKFAPLKQLEEAKDRIENKELVELFNLCPECRKKRIANKGMWNATIATI